MHTERQRTSLRHFFISEQEHLCKESLHHCFFQAIPHCERRTVVSGTRNNGILGASKWNYSTGVFPHKSTLKQGKFQLNSAKLFHSGNGQTLEKIAQIIESLSMVEVLKNCSDEPSGNLI